MTPVETAAVISGCFATGSVGLTAYVAIRGFWSTREATTRAIEAASDDTRRTLSAAREERIWEKRSTAYQETVAYLLYRQERRSFRPFSHITGRDLGTAMRFWFGAYQPPGWSEFRAAWLLMRPTRLWRLTRNLEPLTAKPGTSSMHGKRRTTRRAEIR